MFEGFLPSRTDLENDHLKEISEIVKAGSVKETLTRLVAWQEKNILWQEKTISKSLLICLLSIGCLSLLLNNAPLLAVGLAIIPLIWMFSTIQTLSLTIEEILKNRVGVCRDYAKITMALLYNIPLLHGNKKFFITIPRHVAVVIEVGKKCYVLDQRLPILPLKDWLQLWIRKHKVGYSRLFFHHYKIREWTGDQKKKNDSYPRPKTRKTHYIDTNQIERILNKRLEIQPVLNPGENSLIVHTITVKNFALCYADNEITHFSFIEALKNKIENEFNNKSHKISKIIVNQVGRNIVLEISFCAGNCDSILVHPSKRMAN